jgi:hypothetical protein
LPRTGSIGEKAARVRVRAVFHGHPSAVDVLALPPAAILAFVRRHRADIHPDQDWETLAEGLGSAVACGAGPDPAEEATEAAVIILDRMAEGAGSPAARARYEYDAMSLRAFVIRALGPRAGDPVRDPARLEEWFFGRARAGYDAAAARVRQLGRQPTEEFLETAALLDRVRLLASVRDSCPDRAVFERTAELARWYALLDLVP